ncbi:T-complex protein 1 subunit eta [Coelomomyces lativittatus]|nr:T-complex protein 1 subunit eta [Coelomomyces lativittatus]
MKLLDIVHPAAKTLVDIARAQDAEVGDGTTSVVLLAGELLKQMKTLIEEGMNPQILVKGIRRASVLAIQRIKDLAVALKPDDPEFYSLLCNCASTAMSSKLIHSHKDFFKAMVVDAVLKLDENDSLNEQLIGMKRIPGGGLQDSFLVEGVAFKKMFSYAGFEQQPKSFTNVNIIALNVELELKAEKDNAEVRVDKVGEYQKVVDAEWQIIFEKLEKIVASGAQVVLSKLPIGDLATQYFADRDIFCAGRVPNEDMLRVCKATGASVQSSVNNLKPEHLGKCAKFEEKQIGGERFNLFTGCPKAKSTTLILRGGAEQFIAEVERSLHDAIMIVRRAIKCRDVVAGGGAIEMEVSKYLREQAKLVEGKQQIIMHLFAKALEIIPRTLCDNAGFDATDILNKLRQKHAMDAKGTWFGVDINSESIADNMLQFVWEPTVVKINCLSSATEAACLILSIDETVKSPQNEAQQGGPPGRGRGRGRGMGMRH